MAKSIGPVGRQWLTLVAVLMAIAVNGLSNFYPPAGKNIGEISNTTLAAVLITPAGYAFAIWGLIYVGLIAYCIYQALPSQRHKQSVARVSWWLIGACCLQMLWVYGFLLSYFWLSVVLMFGIVACLMVAYRITRTVPPTRKVRWLFQAPISVYLGWITVAAVVNVASALLVSLPVAWAELSLVTLASTIAMMTVSTGIAATVALRHGDASFPAVVVWALVAIAIRQQEIGPIAFAGIAFAVALGFAVVKIVLAGESRLIPPASDSVP